MILQRGWTAGIVDDVVGQCQPRLSTGLRGQHCFGVLSPDLIAMCQSFDLDRFGHVNHQHPVDPWPATRFCIQGDDQQAIRVFGHADLPQRLFGNQRVQDGFKSCPAGFVRKDGIAHSAPVEPTLSVEKLWTEFPLDLPQSRLAWLDDLAGNDIGIYDRNAETGEVIGNDCLARGNATGQHDRKHFGPVDGVIRCHSFQPKAPVRL